MVIMGQVHLLNRDRGMYVIDGQERPHGPKKLMSVSGSNKYNWQYRTAGKIIKVDVDATIAHYKSMGKSCNIIFENPNAEDEGLKNVVRKVVTAPLSQEQPKDPISNENPHPKEEDLDTGNTAETDEEEQEDKELQALREQYKEKFGEQPHHLMKAETLKAKLNEE